MKYNPRLDLFNERLDRSCISDIGGSIGDSVVKVAVRSTADGKDGSTG